MRARRKIATPWGALEADVLLWTFNGTRLMTHAPVEQGVVMPGAFRVSEETTGFGIPKSWGMTEDEAACAAIEVLRAKAADLPRALAGLKVLNEPCHHEELDMDGVCKSCGLGGAPSRW